MERKKGKILAQVLSFKLCKRFHNSLSKGHLWTAASASLRCCTLKELLRDLLIQQQKVPFVDVNLACNFIKMRPQRRYFPANIAKFSGTTFLMEQLWWMLLKITNNAPIRKKLVNYFSNYFSLTVFYIIKTLVVDKLDSGGPALFMTKIPQNRENRCTRRVFLSQTSKH